MFFRLLFKDTCSDVAHGYHYRGGVAMEIADEKPRPNLIVVPLL